MQIDTGATVHDGVKFRPSMLLFAAFLSSVIIYTPNMRVLERCVSHREIVTMFFLAMMAACAVFALLLALRAVRVRRSPMGRKAAAASAVGYALAQAALVALAAMDDVTLACTAAAVLGIVSAASAGGVVAAWIAAFPSSFRDVMFNGALACALCAALVWLLSVAPAAVVLAGMPALAAVGSLSAVALMPEGGASAAYPAEELGAECVTVEESQGFRASMLNLLSVIWLPLLGLLLCVFMMNTYSIDAAGTSVSECAGSLIASALVIALCVGCKNTPLVVAIDKLALPACAAASIVLGAFPMGTPVFFLGAYTAYAPLVFISIYALASILGASRSGEFPPALAFGTLVFAASVVGLVGFAATCFMGGDPMACGGMLWVMLCGYFAAVMLNLGMTSWQQAVHPLADTDGQPTAAAGLGDDGPAETLMERLRTERVSRLASEHGLTARETELLDYMSRGHNSSYIAQVLFISPSTVRTHFRNIYRKLGVNSREELLALFNGTAC